MLSVTVKSIRVTVVKLNVVMPSVAASIFSILEVAACIDGKFIELYSKTALLML